MLPLLAEVAVHESEATRPRSVSSTFDMTDYYVVDAKLNFCKIVSVTSRSVLYRQYIGKYSELRIGSLKWLRKRQRITSEHKLFGKTVLPRCLKNILG